MHARVDLGLQRLTVRGGAHDALEVLERGLEEAEVRPRLSSSVVPLDVGAVALDGRARVHLRVGVFANLQTRRRAVREQNRLGPSFGGDLDGFGVQLVRFKVFRSHKRGVALLLERLGRGLARDHPGRVRRRRVGLRGPGLAERGGLWPRAPRVPGAFRSLRRQTLDDFNLLRHPLVPGKRALDHGVVLEGARVLAHLGPRRGAPVRRLDVPRIPGEDPVRVGLRLRVLFELEPRGGSIGSNGEGHLLIPQRRSALQARRVEGLRAVHVAALERIVRPALELVRGPRIGRIGRIGLIGLIGRRRLGIRRVAVLIRGIVRVLLDGDPPHRVGLRGRRPRGRRPRGRRRRLLCGRFLDLLDDHGPASSRLQRRPPDLVRERSTLGGEVTVAGLQTQRDVVVRERAVEVAETPPRARSSVESLCVRRVDVRRGGRVGFGGGVLAEQIPRAASVAQRGGHRRVRRERLGVRDDGVGVSFRLEEVVAAGFSLLRGSRRVHRLNRRVNFFGGVVVLLDDGDASHPLPLDVVHDRASRPFVEPSHLLVRGIDRRRGGEVVEGALLRTRFACFQIRGSPTHERLEKLRIEVQRARAVGDGVVPSPLLHQSRRPVAVHRGGVGIQLQRQGVSLNRGSEFLRLEQLVSFLLLAHRNPLLLLLRRAAHRLERALDVHAGAGHR